MNDRLSYQIRGATGERYTITADGFRETFSINCTCRGFARSRKMCRHIAKLLVGDITDVIDKDAEFRPLFLASEFTVTLDAAFKFKDARPQKIAMLPALFHFRDRFEQTLLDRGLAIEMDDEVDPATGRQMLGLHRYHKNGKMKKTPDHVLVYMPLTWDTVASEFGGFERQNVRPRNRPWTANGVAFESLGTAAVHLLRAAGVIA